MVAKVVILNKLSGVIQRQHMTSFADIEYVHVIVKSIAVQ